MTNSTSEYVTDKASGTGDRDSDLLDGIATAAALVADANRKIDPSESAVLADFIDHKGFLPGFTRAEILAAFNRSADRLKQPNGPRDAIESLARFESSAAANHIAEISEQVAKSDRYVPAGELHVLQLICTVLGVPKANPDCAGG